MLDAAVATGGGGGVRHITGQTTPTLIDCTNARHKRDFSPLTLYGEGKLIMPQKKPSVTLANRGNLPFVRSCLEGNRSGAV